MKEKYLITERSILCDKYIFAINGFKCGLIN